MFILKLFLILNVRHAFSHISLIEALNIIDILNLDIVYWRALVLAMLNFGHSLPEI
jgi:hypothetical protein